MLLPVIFIIKSFIELVSLKKMYFKENPEAFLLLTDQLCLSDAIKQLNAYVEKQETQISKLKVGCGLFQQQSVVLLFLQ